MISDAYFEQFQTKKYRSKNPLKRAMIRRFVATVHRLLERTGEPKSVLEIGIGEGFLSGSLLERFPEAKLTGVDIKQDDLELLKKKFPAIETHCASIYELQALPTGYDVVICAEVLEHLEDPARALRQLKARKPKHVLITVPHEPWFMLTNLAAGQNIRRLGNDIEHINHFRVGSLRRLLETEFVLDEITTSYPWILALGRPR